MAGKKGLIYGYYTNGTAARSAGQRKGYADIGAGAVVAGVGGAVGVFNGNINTAEQGGSF